MGMSVRFWGVRGSCPSPGPETASFGGNTSCVEVRCGDQLFILDAGTGLRGLGNQLLASGQPVHATFLFSHVHWDHIQGFPFFSPLFRKNTELNLCGRVGHGSLVEALGKQMSGPSFPVELDQVPAQLAFRPILPGKTLGFGPAEVTAAALHHPNGVMAFRIDYRGRSLVYATDTEHYSDRLDNDLVALARGADLLIYDAQYTPEEYDGRAGFARVGWGHSTWSEGVNVARAAGVRQLCLFHHDPSHDDGTVAAIERAARSELPGTIAAREGMTVELESRAASVAA
jgi:phosphoribosyl 1,2-cyclic phosphodiesterase